jgi:nucleoside-diphosphate-sugar epimerase
MRTNGSNSRVLLYGAYGFTGRLAAELAAAKKLDVVLAGRNQDARAGFGHRLSLPTRVVGLNDTEQLSAALKDIACVVHMAIADFRKDPAKPKEFAIVARFGQKRLTAWARPLW